MTHASSDTILTELRALKDSIDEHKRDLFTWREYVENILKRQDSELIRHRSRHDEVDYRLRRLAEDAMDGPRMWRMASLSAVVAGIASFGAVLLGQLLNH